MEQAGAPYLRPLLVPSILFGALLGTIVFARLCDYIGRRRSLLMVHGWYLVGVLFLAGLSWNLWLFAVIRLLLGFAVGGRLVSIS